MNRLNILLIISASLLFIACAPKVQDERVQYVHDETHLLTVGQRDSLNRELADLEKSIGSQMVILIISSLDGQKIEDYSLNTANSWGLGRNEYADGILITVALADRQMRIEVGLGLEKIITDEIAGDIIRGQMAPEFRENKYFQGLYAAVKRMKALISENKSLIGQRP